MEGPSKISCLEGRICWSESESWSSGKHDCGSRWVLKAELLWFTKVTSPASIFILSAVSSISGLFTSLTLAKTQNPNRNRLLGKGVSGRAQNAKPGNLREPEPSLRHRKTAGQPPRRKGGGARKRSKSRVTDSWDACARLRGLRNRGSV